MIVKITLKKIKSGFDKEVLLFTNPINDGTNRENEAYSGYDKYKK